jgi:TetR/AcrR family transcriptional regulator, transcriptional repressor of bet genes
MIEQFGQTCQVADMKLKPLSDIRRAELRRAAFEVLQTQGLAGATLERVAAHAGASKGIVLHYFANKQELFEQVMREANAALRDAVIMRLRQASTAKERLEAIINGNFDGRFFQPLICQAWLSLCAEWLLQMMCYPFRRQFRPILTVFG